MAALPQFDANGNLPPGFHEVTMNEIAARLAWSNKRRKLLEGLKRAVANLRTAGVQRLWIDGSFTTNKEEPNDIDGCWEYSRDVLLHRLDPVFLDVHPPRKAMKTKYGVDFLVSTATLTDPSAHGTTVLDFFQVDRDGNPKGILSVDLGARP